MGTRANSIATLIKDGINIDKDRVNVLLAEEFPTIVAGTDSATLSDAFDIDQLSVFLNGVKLKKTTEYTLADSALVLASGETFATDDVLSVLINSAAPAYTDKFTTLTDVSVAGQDSNTLVKFNGSNYTPTTLVEDGSGNVGIGTSSPAEKLDVYGSIGLGGKEIARRSGNDVLLGDVNAAGGGGAVTIRTSGGDKLKVDTSGRLLVGTTGVPNVSFGQTGFSVSSTELVFSSNTNGGNALSYWRTEAVNSSVASYWRGNSNVGSVSVTAGATSYNTSSDYRLKENVVDLTSAIERLKLIPVHRFNFIVDPDTTVDGFLAHEVQPHVPEAVTGEKDAVDENGDIKPQGIDQSKLVPLLTAAIQEQQTQIEAQQATISALEARLTALEGA